MKATHQPKELRWGDFITVVHCARAKRRARRVVRLAANTHLLVFRGHRHFVIP